MYHPPNPSIHHPNHLWFICTNQNGLQYPPESTTFHPIPPLHFYYYMNQDLIAHILIVHYLPENATTMPTPTCTEYYISIHTIQQSAGQVKHFVCIVLSAVVSAFEYFFCCTVPPILHLTQCIIFCYHSFYRYAQPNHAPTIKWRIQKWIYLLICCNIVRADVLASVGQLEQPKYNSRGLTQCCYV